MRCCHRIRSRVRHASIAAPCTLVSVDIERVERPSDSQSQAGPGFRASPEGTPEAVLSAAVLAAPEPRRAGLGTRKAQRLQTPRTDQGRDETAGHRRSVPNPKVARTGEILLRQPECQYAAI